jgi:hypothetical protein
MANALVVHKDRLPQSKKLLHAAQYPSPAFPFLTARSRKEMLRFRPRFRHPELTLVPSNLADAEARGPGLTPLFPSSEDLALDIKAPDGKTMPMSDPELLRCLKALSCALLI